MCCTGEHHHLDYVVPSSPAVIMRAVRKATERIRLTSAVTELSTFRQSGHRHIETIRMPFWASSRFAGVSLALPEVAQLSDWEDGDHTPGTSNIFRISRRGALACGR